MSTSAFILQVFFTKVIRIGSVIYYSDSDLETLLIFLVWVVRSILANFNLLVVLLKHSVKFDCSALLNHDETLWHMFRSVYIYPDVTISFLMHEDVYIHDVVNQFVTMSMCCTIITNALKVAYISQEYYQIDIIPINQ